MVVSNESVRKNRVFRDGIALTLIVYCTSFLFFYQFYFGESIISGLQHFREDTDGLYLAATILINLGSIILFLYDFISGKSNTIVNIVCSVFLILGGLCYLIGFSIDMQHISGYEIAYYVGCVFFVSFKSFFLAALILSDNSSSKTKTLTKCSVSIITAICMIIYWFYYYNDIMQMQSKPTQAQYGLIMSGWCIVMIFSIAIIVYEVASYIKKQGIGLAFGVLLCVGSFLLFIGSILYNTQINNKDNLQISSEWSLGLSVMIASITTTISLANNYKESSKESKEYLIAV